MLKLTGITKDYQVGDLRTHALCGVDIEFRRNEFVAILGPSGCGKTTLLNIIGGLDRYTDGDLIIGGVSTKDYKDADWDTYRNHSVGFVFQSYNLIPHQTVLANVELALTLTGVPKAERVRRAKAVLERVGLGEQIHKKPNQLSGGQMQRVAIARALVNDPDIILADEPTGALDSETSVQVMDVLREISGEKLIIMVTHNAELAEEYADRIVRLKDGRVIDDTNPCPPGEGEKTPAEKRGKKQKKPSMSFFTALSLSLNNLLTKKTRTILTALAGSIGIIGIAAILALSTGIERYIESMEEGTLSSYPLTIQSETMDMSAFLTGLTGEMENWEEHEKDKVYSVSVMTDVVNTFAGGVTKNDMTAFKKFLESGESGIEPYITDISYSYNTPLNVYRTDENGKVAQVNPSQLMDKMGMSNPMMEYGSSFGSMGSADAWTELIGDEELLSRQYDVLAGRLPSAADEVVFIVSKNNEVSDFMLYTLALLDQDELRDIAQKILNNEPIETEDVTMTYEEVLDLRFKLLPNTGLYEKDSAGVWQDISGNKMRLAAAVAAAPEIKVVGILRAAEGSSGAISGDKIGYTHGLTSWLLELINSSEIVREQKENPDVDIFTGIAFDAAESAPEIPEFHTMEELQAFAMMLPEAEQQELMAGVTQMQGAGMPAEQILSLINSQLGQMPTTDATYEGNLNRLGVADPDAPSIINIYPADFESKDRIVEIIEAYNESVPEESRIHYTDYVGLLMSSITTIINAISYVLIAFVSISLIVSSIMIGIITYISVLERTKEIGILRAMGASKRDVSRVFNAETIIIGLISGLIGIGATLLLCLPSGAVLRHFAGIEAAAVLPPVAAVVLVCVSVLLTFIAGLIPSGIAAKKDPVIALRTE